jgi:hypothetical protein
VDAGGELVKEEKGSINVEIWCCYGGCSIALQETYDGKQI